MATVLTVTQSTSVLIWTTSTGGPVSTGGVVAVLAGANVTVDNTDPTRPVVASTGGGGGGAVASVNGHTGVVVLAASDVGADASGAATAAQAFAIQRANHTGTESADVLTDGTTNKAFLATERTKLTGIATGATANSTDATLLARANHTGTESADVLTDGTTNKAFLATERTKLTGIATGATANSTDAVLLARANHTGTESADVLTDGTTNKAFLATERTKLAAISGTNTGDQVLPTTLPPNGAATGDLSGTYPAPTVAKVNGTALSGLATGLLKNTTTTGVPSIAVAADVPTVAAGSTGPLSATDATTTNSRTPSGAASGDLAGTYPSPTLGTTAVTAGSYTAANITVDAKGRITSAANGGGGAPSGAASGDLSGTYPAPNVAKINGTALSGLATGLLKNTTTTGVPSIAAAADVPTVAAGSTGPLSATDATTTNSRAPSGAAGGDLTGTYPNPTFAAAGTAGTYGDATHVPQFTTDAKGRVTAVTAVSITVPTSLPPNGAATGDLSGTYPAPTVAKVNGVALSGLATGLLKNTTTTGVPSIAVGADIPNIAESQVTNLVTDLAGKVPTTRTVSPGTGLTGGGDLSANRTLTLADTAVTPGAYTAANITVDQQGRITLAANGTGGGGSPTGAAGGDLSGTYPNPGVAKLNGTALSGLATGLVKNTTATGVPSIAVAADVPTVAAGSTGPLSATDATTTNSRTPTGSAGGDLTGTYPNPTLGTTAVTAGSYTAANITVDAKGRITSAANGGGGASATNGYPMPTGAICESIPRGTTTSNVTAAASGGMKLLGVSLLAGQVISAVTFASGATGLATGTHQWAVLTDTSGTVLAVSPDATSAAWSANSLKTFTFGAAYTVPTTGMYYAGLMIAATTVPTLWGASSSLNLIAALTPAVSGSAGSGLTTPPALASSVGTITPSAANVYCYLS